MSKWSAPIRMSLMLSPMVWVPGASMQALAIDGLASHSPVPETPRSVWMATTRLSWADEVKRESKSGASSTWQSIPVILRRCGVPVRKGETVANCIDDTPSVLRLSSSRSFLCPLTRAVAAIDCDRLTGYEGSEIGREINREVAHFLKPAGARDRMHSSLRFKCRFGIIFELRNLDRQGPLDIARTNGVDPY